MGEGMPYHLEKGPTLRTIEKRINGYSDRASRQGLLNRMRNGVQVGWLDAIPNLWDAYPMTKAPRDPEIHVIEDWFGYEDPTVTRTWQPGPGPTTGYWIGYKGDVNTIVRTAIQWALEVSLGNQPPGSGSNNPPPLPIELFWKCPSPWFEAWVVRRPVGLGASVSVLFLTPSHRGANVAESPIATSPITHPDGSAHPVPSTEDDYFAFTPGVGQAVGSQAGRSYAMWVVTHQNHVTDPQVREQFGGNTAAPGDFNDWGVPYLNVYRGIDPVVVVSPSSNAGGVRKGGQV